MRKYLFGIMLGWLTIWIFLWVYDDFVIYKFYNRAIFPTFMSVLISSFIIHTHGTYNGFYNKIIITILMIFDVGIAYHFESRTAFIVIMITLFFLMKKIYKKFFSSIILITIVVIGILAISFMFKVDSSNGRILIWKNSFSILADNWISGIGLGRFPRIYMEYQQSFLSSLPCSDKYVILAGNTSFAYNDLLEFMCKFGLMAVLLVICGFLYTYPIKKKTNINTICALLVIFIVSLFNYFLQALYCQLFTIVLISILKSSNRKFQYRIRNIVLILMGSVVLLGSSLIYFVKYSNYRDVINTFQSVNHVYRCSLYDNPDYWWRYANLSFSQRKYHDAIYALNNISNFVKNNSTEYLYAKSFQKLGQYELAEEHFKNAIEMYPSKYSCRYDLMLLYKEMGRYDDGASVARGIIEMPQKVSTGLTFFIIKSAKKYLIDYKGEKN